MRIVSYHRGREKLDKAFPFNLEQFPHNINKAAKSDGQHN